MAGEDSDVPLLDASVGASFASDGVRITVLVRGGSWVFASLVFVRGGSCSRRLVFAAAQANTSFLVVLIF